MKKGKIAGGVLFLLLMCAGAICAALWFTSTMLISNLHLEGIEPGLRTAYDLSQSGENKRVKGFAAISMIASGGIPFGIFGLMIYTIFVPKKRELHGSGKFAGRMELVKGGLLEADKPGDKFPSIVVGKMGKEFLFFRGQQFMYLAAPTRSGKGVGIIIPNLLHYRDSVVVLDIKGENFKKTSGFRAKCGQEVHKFSPDDEDYATACWNPMAYVRDDPRFRVSDLMTITNTLYPPSDDVWASTAESLFLGIALYCMETAKERDNFNIAHIKKLPVMLPFLKDEDTLMAYVKSREPFEPLSEECVYQLRKYAQTSEKLRNSIMISFDQPLLIFADPITAKATSKNSFSFLDVRRKRMSIYVVISPKNIEKFGKLLNLFFQQLLNLNMDELPEDNPALRYQCLLVLDEFTAMGRVGIIEKAS
ncbi:type IV secretory system conjugative DNA transfer family protein, partial [Massilia sp. CCM 9210]|uniref:type IV secretory system conjugative DNA transfer family protein n=1 Tax=Massilia scottii TaxID=3057166 RepID=UPI0027968A9D